MNATTATLRFRCLCSMAIYVSSRIQLWQYFASFDYAPWQFTFLQEYSCGNTSLSLIMLHGNSCFFKNTAVAILRFLSLCSMAIHVSSRIQLWQYLAFVDYAPWQFMFLQEYSYGNTSLSLIMLHGNSCFFKNTAVAILRLL
jgi:hypothetical protein